MNKKRILLILFILMFMFSVVLVSACSPAQRPGPTEETPSPTPSTPVVPQDTKKAEDLAEKISEMKDVNSATVVISENQAWVGVDLASGLEDEMTDEMKNEITSLVKKEDKEIDTVYVTADADAVTRIKNIARDVADGKPISGFIDELNEIGRRITPSQQ
ncbi:MAG: YhcN/YlaJ family sporulation lipoprotein [Peptococcia bacterium]|jgi:YhcN/YlaJ family sporulation lipoprotein